MSRCWKLSGNIFQIHDHTLCMQYMYWYLSLYVLILRRYLIYVLTDCTEFTEIKLPPQIFPFFSTDLFILTRQLEYV